MHLRVFLIIKGIIHTDAPLFCVGYTMISIENLAKSYGGNRLFTGASFKINSRERIGLVGRNGHGKTTLFRMIIGVEEPDKGAVSIPRHYRIGYVSQTIEFTQATVLQEGMQGLGEAESDHYWKVEKILAGLGFRPQDMQRRPETFSGGFQVRLNLAKILVSEPDLLLLDEPTNYLDITSIRWIQGFLQRWPREVMLITHDWGFMDKIVTHVVGIHRKKMRKISGDTGKYYERIAQDDEIFEKTRLNDERRCKEVQQFISRFRAKARLAGMVQSRIKTLSKMEKKNKLEKLKTLEFAFRSRPYRAKHVCSVEDLGFAYENHVPLIDGFNLTLQNGDRVCVVGKNGQGKTTLLKLLAGSLSPCQGSVTYHPLVVKGIFEQTHIQTLHQAHTVEEEILQADDGVDKQTARNICAAMLFAKDEALKKISVLSGGEKNRVVLGKILATPVNLLLLDEPTNHLDMDACDALLAAIDSFEGTVVMVTHNEMFLHALAQRLIVFQEDDILVFDGSYQEFLETQGWHEESSAFKTSTKNAEFTATPVKITKKELRRRRSEIIAARSRVLKPLEARIAQMEDDIDAQEKKLDELNTAMLQASQAQDGPKIEELGRSIHSCHTIIEQRFEALEETTLALEQKRVQFDGQMAELEEEGFKDSRVQVKGKMIKS